MSIDRDEIFKAVGIKPFLLMTFPEGIYYDEYKHMVGELLYSHNSFGCLIHAPVDLREFEGDDILDSPASCKGCFKGGGIDSEQIKNALNGKSCLLITFPDGVDSDDFRLLMGAFYYGSILRDTISSICVLHEFGTENLTRI